MSILGKIKGFFRSKGSGNFPMIEKNRAIDETIILLSRLFKAPGRSFEDNVTLALQRLVDITGCDEIRIMRKKDNIQKVEFEYSRSVKNKKEFASFMPYNKQEWMIEQNLKNGYVAINNVDDIPDTALELRRHLQKEKVGALLCTSFVGSYEFKGTITLFYYHPIEKWNRSTIKLFLFVASIIEAQYEKLEAIDKLTKVSIQAEESDKLKSAFLMNLSHEVRTPLNSIVGFSNILGKTELQTSKREEISQILSIKSKQLLSVMDDLMDIAKIESETIEFHITQFKITKLMNILRNKFADEITIKGNIEYDVSADKFAVDETIESDFDLLVQMVCNLIKNAIKFTDQGRIAVLITKEDGNTQISVSDTGIGIEEVHFDNIFKRFWQIDMSTTRKYGGNGLGLAICKEYANKMGYTISVKSKVGIGSTFTLTIPQKQKCQLSNSNKKEFKKNILVIDDFDIIHKYICDIVNPVGYNCVCTTNQPEAIALLQTENFDAVLLDVNMDNNSGKYIFDCIRDINPTIPIIGHSIIMKPEERDHYLKMGFYEFLEKPQRPAILIKTLEDCTAKQKEIPLFNKSSQAATK